MPGRRRESELKVVFGQAFRSKRRAEVGSEAFRSERWAGVGGERFSSWPGLPVGEADRSRKRAPFLLGQAFRSETGSPFWPVVRFLGRPRSCASFAMLFAGPSFC